MPRVKQVVAAKDYPEFGITKGTKHYFWKRKLGPRSSKTYRQVEPPRIEQLTSSAFRIAIHHMEEQRNKIDSYEDVQVLVESVNELKEETEGSLENMPEGLREGDTGQTLQERISTLETAAEELEQIASDWEQALNDHDGAREEYDAYQTALEEWEAEETDEDEPEDVEDPGEFDPAEYLDRVNDVQLEP